MLLNPPRASLSREAAAAPPGLFCSIILGCCYSSLALRRATGHSILGISLILGFPLAQGPAGAPTSWGLHLEGGACMAPVCGVPAGSPRCDPCAWGHSRQGQGSFPVCSLARSLF